MIDVYVFGQGDEQPVRRYADLERLLSELERKQQLSEPEIKEE